MRMKWTMTQWTTTSWTWRLFLCFCWISFPYRATVLIVPHVCLRRQKCGFEYDMTDANFLAPEVNTKEENHRKIQTFRSLSSGDTEQESRIFSLLHGTVELIFDALVRPEWSAIGRRSHCCDPRCESRLETEEKHRCHHSERVLEMNVG
jgi:hypothetical protein